MEIPITLLSLTESFIVSVLVGASTMAVVSYVVCLRYGYPKEGVGRILIQIIYTIIRLFHILLAVLVVLCILVYGVLDGIQEAQVEYGIKAFVLFVNALVAYGMARRFLPIDYFAPVIAGGWYFLAAYHSFTLHIASVNVTAPLIWYAAFIILLSFLFVLFRALAAQSAALRGAEET